MQAEPHTEHRTEKWIRFSARTMLLFKKKASDLSQKCKSTFGSDAVAREGRARRLLWFVLIYVASLAVFAALVYGLRWTIPR